MLNFTHDNPIKLLFGKGQIENLAEVLAPFGKKILLTYGGGSIKKNGLYDTVTEILCKNGFSVTELSGIDPNPRIESVAEGVRLCRENGIDAILSVGGGSTLDCSKAIAVGVYYEGDLWDMVCAAHDMEMGRRPVERRKALPLVDIMTISATGSEFNGGGVISNMNTREKFGGVFTRPAVSILDPTLTYTVSSYQTAAGSIDIMVHIMEEYFSRTEDSDLSEGIAETVLRSVMKNAPAAIAKPDDYSARANLMTDAAIACSNIPGYGKQSGGWPLHSMEHSLSAFYDITHGVGLAVLTPRWMRYILKKDPTCTWRFVRFAENVFGLQGEEETKLAEAGIDALEAFFRSLDIPMTFAELGIGTEHFEEMAAQANEDGYMQYAFVALTDEDIVEIFKACL